MVDIPTYLDDEEFPYCDEFYERDLDKEDFRSMPNKRCHLERLDRRENKKKTDRKRQRRKKRQEKYQSGW